MAGPVHYEVYIRKTAPAPWSLLMATEDRKAAIETAEDLLKDDRAAAVRVTKETLDPETMAFSSFTVLTKGAPEVKRKRLVEESGGGSVCSSPQDLYAPHARERLAQVMEDWLGRNGVTAFELLHRPDLAEKLEASGVEIQHAIQRVAVPESQATGQSVHDLVRHYQKLADRTVERVILAGRRGLFPDLSQRRVADVAVHLAGSSDRAFAMGGAVCAFVQDAKGARARLERLMDIVDGAPADGPPRALVLVPVEQFLCELLSQRTNLAQVLGPSLDQGASLAAVVRMAAPREVEALIRFDPRLELLIPPVEGAAIRLGDHLAAGEFPLLAAALARMVVRELMSPRRLRPSDAPGEIDILRALATALTATAGRLLTLDEVQNAFVERSKTLVTADFVAAYVKGCDTVLCEAELLTRLCENVTGGANKRSAARWLAACVSSLRFETEMRQSGGTAAQKLNILAGLQKSVRTAALTEHDEQAICDGIGVLGGLVEADARLTVQLARAPAPAVQKLGLLLRLAAGDTAPTGPAADRAKAEALKLLRAPDARAALGADPQALVQLRPMMKAAGLAA